MATPLAPARPPLPRWFTAGAAVLVALGLFLVWLTGSDWADGGKRAGIAAFVVAAIVLGVFVFRYVNGYRAARALGLAIASILVLIILGSAGIGLQGPLHQLQGGALAGKQQFEAAINEFQLANDNAGIASTYNDWGDLELQQQNYKVPDDVTSPATEGALAKYTYVLTKYAQSTDTAVIQQVRRAKEGAARVYLAWGDQYLAKAASAGDSQDAIDLYKGAVDRFNLALQDARDFGSTAAFPKIHKEAAKAYFGLGKQQESQDCTGAASTLTTLVKNFNDTPEAQMAQTELKKPQDITGEVISTANNAPVPNVKLFLSAHWQFSSSGYTASNDASTTSAADGTFAFKNITPGDTKYLISFIDATGREVTAVSRASGQPIYVVQVMPLCAPQPVVIAYDLPSA